MNIELRGAPIERMPGGMVGPIMHACGLSRVHEDQAFIMLDEPAEDWEPFCPFRIEEHVGQS